MHVPSTGGRPLQKNSARTWLAIGLAASLAWAIFLMSAGPRGGGDLSPPSLETSGLHPPADFRWGLLDLDGKPIDFASFRGRPILLNLWATWCGPCLEEMPSIAALAANRRLKDKGVVFLCVSIDESAEGLRRFVKEKSWKMTILRATSTPPVFGTEGIPATFLIAPDGQVIVSQVGPAKWDDVSVVEFLEKLATPAR